ncbi:transmembrane protein, putative (macronuclear) [Tetrahymena thermophila SB210]|uniref:Transmembrane protein, putative n=1 Tax=Tetrahymena thermophila (strain SB210) TaxID=312017 RepID=W7XLJ3_TETTS|nr:transmembrane protein, putative [Tetrahymena thermophila SB210]EWS76389.1 transmembrane protein, putative [Tetrahymena thermophila SB210]|eukprot:XP_012651173.1 transmembrane protein, putative [Tetrahymena thermophila SB210]
MIFPLNREYQQLLRFLKYYYLLYKLIINQISQKYLKSDFSKNKQIKNNLIESKMSKSPQYIKIAFILFVKLNQMNWLFYFFNNQIYKETGTFPLKINLVFLLSHFIAIFKLHRNQKRLEILFVAILSLLQIEDLYFLIRFDKFKKYYIKDDNKGWIIRYIFALSIITFQILILQANYQTSCFYLVLPRISLVILCYIYQYYLLLGESQLYKIIEQIQLKNLILSSFQMFCFFYL